MTIAYIINRLPSSLLGNKTSYEVLFHEVPIYTTLKVFGCSNPSRDGKKFQPKGVPCIFLGYPTTQKEYKLLNLRTKQTFVSRDVRFYKDIFPYKLHNHRLIPPPPSSLTKQPLPWTFDSLDTLIPPDCISVPSDVDTSSPSSGVMSPSSQSHIPSLPQSTTPMAVSQSPTLRRSTRSSKTPKWLQDFVAQVSLPKVDSSPTYPMASCVSFVNSSVVHKGFLTTLDHSQDHTTFAEAVLDPKWCEAMNLELRALEDNGTWEITSLPPGKRAIGCK